MAANKQMLTPIQRHMLNMFIALRWGVGLAGLALPVILAGVGYLEYKIPLSGSMSAYYHATESCSGQTAEDGLKDPAKAPAACFAPGTGPMRNWFVGSLFFIGGAMLLMRGFSVWEDLALNIAGVTAPCVALFPMSWIGQSGFNPHMTFAVIFFLSVGFTAVFCSEKTLKEIPPQTPNREKLIAFFRLWYRVLGFLMVALPLFAHLVLAQFVARTFMVEAAGVWAFGSYWLFKTFELKRSDIEIRALTGQLNPNRRNLS
ncbi:MAG: hypothetical protein WBP85_08020 [Terracidiphilus sp.]